jgi:hypothetical protein
VAGLRPVPFGPLAPGTRRPAADIVGMTTEGAPIEVRIGHPGPPLLVAFLHTRCDGCDQFWRGLGGGAGSELPASVDAVVVTKGGGQVAADEVRALALRCDPRVPVVMSDQAWSDYQVLGYPCFVLVDRIGGVIVGETTAFGWSDVASMIREAGY